MKTFFSRRTFLALLLPVLACGLGLFVSCEQADNVLARLAIEVSIKALQNGDYDTFINNYDIPESQKKDMLELYKQKIAPALEKQGGIKSYQITEKSFDKEAGKATYEVTLNFGDGTSRTSNQDMVKTSDGWKMVLVK